MLIHRNFHSKKQYSRLISVNCVKCIVNSILWHEAVSKLKDVFYTSDERYFEFLYASQLSSRSLYFIQYFSILFIISLWPKTKDVIRLTPVSLCLCVYYVVAPESLILVRIFLFGSQAKVVFDEISLKVMLIAFFKLSGAIN